MGNSFRRIINVSNRLPIKITSIDGTITYQASEGGLATGLSSIFSEYENVWMGWPGTVIEENEKKQTVVEDLRDRDLFPVFLTHDEVNKFYEGFSNETIWPLFHYFPTYSSYSQDYWQTYLDVNQKYADEILKIATKDDIIWVHDYHLMLLPALLREAMPELTIGYFQHIPFPTYEIFRALPWKAEILKGLLGADMIGFQTEDDVHHFNNTAHRVLNLQSQQTEFHIEGRRITVQAFPISIDYKKYSELAEHGDTKRAVQKLKKLIDTKIIISIDRLDYSKGILQRLQAYDLFLKQHPEWHQRVTFVHLVVPSRDNVRNYKELKEEMNRLITDINGKYATIGWQPIHHFYRSFPPNLLSALYRVADLALVTPLIDGMNLVCKEFVASNTARNGVLILGEAAGAARELKDALIINPNDIDGFACKINEGLTLPEAERKQRMEKMQAVVARADIFNWAENFIDKLLSLREAKTKRLCIPIQSSVLHKIDLQYAYAHKRLILLDYDGTLVPYQKKPEDAYPDMALLRLLKNLSADERNHVVIISGRDKAILDKWLGQLPISLVAEHGAWYKDANSSWYCVPGLDTKWKKTVSSIFSTYSSKTPHTFTEEKTYGMAWHYRMADDKLGNAQAKLLIRELRKKLNDETVNVLPGNKVVEVKNSMVNKGTAALRFMAKQGYDFIIAIGDDATDEDMFNILPDDSITIRVGSDISAATYSQSTYSDVRTLLQEMYYTSMEQSGSTKIQMAG